MLLCPKKYNIIPYSRIFCHFSKKYQSVPYFSVDVKKNMNLEDLFSFCLWYKEKKNAMASL